MNKTYLSEGEIGYYPNDALALSASQQKPALTISAPKATTKLPTAGPELMEKLNETKLTWTDGTLNQTQMEKQTAPDYLEDLSYQDGTLQSLLMAIEGGMTPDAIYSQEADGWEEAQAQAEEAWKAETDADEALADALQEPINF